MSAYLKAFESSLPLPPLTCVLVWFLLYAAAQVLGWRLARLGELHPQTSILIGGATVQIKKQSWVLMCVQLTLTAMIFLAGYALGPLGFAFLAGGWVVTTAVSIPIMLRKILFHRSLLLPGAATGSVTLSGPLSVKSASFELFGLAAFVTVLGLIFANPALLGGSFFIAATGLGYLRKAIAGESKFVTAQQDASPNAAPPHR